MFIELVAGREDRALQKLCEIVQDLKIAWVHHFLSFAIISSHINNVLLYNATNVASKMC